MPDDILDAAQKAINDAAKHAGSSPPSGTPPAETPGSPSSIHQPSVRQPTATPPDAGNPPPTLPPNEPTPALPAEPPPEPAPEPAVKSQEPPLPTPDEATKKEAEELVDQLLTSAASSAPTAAKPPPIKPKKPKIGPLLAVIFLLLVAIPVGASLVSQRQELADVRSKAASDEGECPEGGNCLTHTQCSSRGGRAIDFCVKTKINVCCIVPPTPTRAPTPTPTPTPPECKPPKSCHHRKCGSGYESTDGKCETDFVCCKPESTTSPTPPGGAGAVVTTTGRWQCSLGAPPIGTQCLRPRTREPNGRVFNGKCMIVHCPKGCGTNQPDKCNATDPGAWTEKRDCDSATLVANECGQIDTVSDDGSYCLPETGCDVKQLDCSPPCGGGPTQPPKEAQCRNIKIYKDGVQVDPTTLKLGDEIVLAVKGDGSPSKGRFRINNGAWQVTEMKNSQGEFTLTLTLGPEHLSAENTVTVEAEVFADGKWK